MTPLFTLLVPDHKLTVYSVYLVSIRSSIYTFAHNSDTGKVGHIFSCTSHLGKYVTSKTTLQNMDPIQLNYNYGFDGHTNSDKIKLSGNGAKFQIKHWTVSSVQNFSFQSD